MDQQTWERMTAAEREAIRKPAYPPQYEPWHAEGDRMNAPEHRVYIHVVTQRFCKCEPKGDPERLPGLAMPIEDGILWVKCSGCGAKYMVSGPSIRFTVEYGEAPGSVEGVWVPKPVEKPIPLEPVPEPPHTPQTFSREVTPYDRELVKRYGIKLE